MKPQFDYASFAARNIGFVTADAQARLGRSCVFVCGVGGMGGKAFMGLQRAGVVRPDPQPESLNDPTLRKPGDALTEKDKHAAVLRESAS
jgi:hypothetical protein